jgi:hypothetical protein
MNRSVQPVSGSPTVEGLGTEGPMGGNPAMTVGGIMQFVSMMVGLAIATKFYVPSPEIQAWANQWGLTAATFLLTGWGLLQAWITRNRVFSPASLVSNYLQPLADRVQPMAGEAPLSGDITPVNVEAKVLKVS